MFTDRICIVEERNIMKRNISVCLALFAAAGGIFALNATAGQTAPNPKAVEEALSGKRTTVNAAWWGFNGKDDTDALQAAINSGAKKVIVPNMGKDWIIRPVALAGNQEVIFEKGTTVTAKKGEFKGGNDCLFRASSMENIILKGYGAILRMQKEDYMTSAYTKAEWRMVLSFLSCSNVRIEGLTLSGSGGDGIYLGVDKSRQLYNSNVHIKDVICENNYRQGISVISAENLLIENCRFSNTWGTAPEAGIDLEPNHPEERLSNCVIRNCTFENNKGAGIALYLAPLSGKSDPISITFENCRVRSDRGPGIFVGAIKDDGPNGSIIFRKCTVEDAAGYGLWIRGKAAHRAKVVFDRCAWKRTASNAKDHPLLFGYRDAKEVKLMGGIEFRNCMVEDDGDRPFLSLDDRGTGFGLSGVTGTIRVKNLHGKRMDLGTGKAGANIQIK